MGKWTGRSYGGGEARRAAVATSVFRGVLTSFAAAAICLLLLTAAGFLLESPWLEGHLTYVMTAVTLFSVFAGSAVAAYKARANGWLIGLLTGLIYILCAVGIGMEMSSQSIAPAVFANKCAAGAAAGLVGGLVGVNL